LILVILRAHTAISEHGVFHGITICRKNNSLKKKDKNGLFTIERE
jgi:hypothetical protein